MFNPTLRGWINYYIPPAYSTLCLRGMIAEVKREVGALEQALREFAEE